MSTKSGSARSDGSRRSEKSRRASTTTSHRSSRSQDSRQSSSPSRQNQKTPRSPRHNKIYHCPPTPPPEELLFKEKSFILDNMATASISSDYARANPKLGPVIPPYNSQRDRHTTNYFKFHGVDRTLKKTGQNDDEDDENQKSTSIEGRYIDYFHTQGKGYQYLTSRNQSGAGHSRESIDGHSQFMQGLKPVIGYHGAYGFRRNTPWLRQVPSPFGTTTLSKLHEQNKAPTC